MGRRRTNARAPNVRWTPAGYRFEVRDRRLDGGRMDISLGVRTEADADVANATAAAIRTMIDRGEKEVERALRARKITAADVNRAARTGDWASLRIAHVTQETIGTAVAQTLEDVEATQEAGTLREYRVVARLLLAHFTRDRPLRDVSTTDAEAFLREPKASIDDRVWSANRQQKVSALAGRIWADAEARARDAADKAGLGHKPLPNPWRTARLPRVRQTRVEWLRLDEWATLLAANRGYAVAAPLALACRAGLRAAEILNLRTDVDVDLGARIVHVQPRGGEHEWRPKSDTGIRDIPMAAELYDVLVEHIEAGFVGERYLVRAGSSRGTAPLSYWGLLAWVKDAFARGGIKYGRERDALTLHSLRHSFGSQLAQQDVQMKRIAQLMGISLAVADPTYTHLLPEDDREAIDRIDRALAEGMTR